MRKAPRGLSLFPVVALALLVVAPSAADEPVLPWCPDPGPDDEGFYACPCPACMAPCEWVANPQGECKGPDGSVSASTYTCCCCGGSDASFRYPAPVLALHGLRAGSMLTWTNVPGATAFDLVGGDLAGLRAHGGDFGQATAGCLDDDNPGTTLWVDATPASGQCLWFLIRGQEEGSYNAPSGSQITPRDVAIASSGNDCS